MSEREPALISMCALGIGCRYHGQTVVMGHSIYKERRVRELQRRYHLIPVCPEQLGGLPTPRAPCDLVGGRVIRRSDGADLTEPFERGAAAAVRVAAVLGARRAYLKDRSPSCGADCGVAARALSAAGVRVFRV